MPRITLRKSALQDYARCPMLFKLRWIDGIREEHSTYEAELGRSFHSIAQELLTKHNPPLPKDPVPTSNAELREMIRWFVMLENKRYEILKQLGREDLWRPVATEWEIKATIHLDPDVEIDAVGHIDRLDRDIDGHYILIEYKTTRQPHLTDWRRELMFYRWILREMGYRVTQFVVINPMLRDYFVEKPKPYTEVALRKLLVKLAHDTEFAPRPGEHCIFCPMRKYCPYYNGR